MIFSLFFILNLPAPGTDGELGAAAVLPGVSVNCAVLEADAVAGDVEVGVGRDLLSAKSNTRITNCLVYF